jgi:hypothetical protein
MEIWWRCFDGTALDNHTPLTRLARLLAANPNGAAPPTDRAARAFDCLDDNTRETLGRFLARVAVHRWQGMAAALGPDDRMALLVGIADAWAESHADHVVLVEETTPDGTSAASGSQMGRVDTALSGIRLLVLDR